FPKGSCRGWRVGGKPRSECKSTDSPLTERFHHYRSLQRYQTPQSSVQPDDNVFAGITALLASRSAVLPESASPDPLSHNSRRASNPPDASVSPRARCHSSGRRVFTRLAPAPCESPQRHPWYRPPPPP